MILQMMRGEEVIARDEGCIIWCGMFCLSHMIIAQEKAWLTSSS